jgi:hypothetical protein
MVRESARVSVGASFTMVVAAMSVRAFVRTTVRAYEAAASVECVLESVMAMMVGELPPLGMLESRLNLVMVVLVVVLVVGLEMVRSVVMAMSSKVILASRADRLEGQIDIAVPLGDELPAPPLRHVEAGLVELLLELLLESLLILLLLGVVEAGLVGDDRGPGVGGALEGQVQAHGAAGEVVENVAQLLVRGDAHLVLLLVGVAHVQLSGRPVEGLPHLLLELGERGVGSDGHHPVLLSGRDFDANGVLVHDGVVGVVHDVGVD